MAFTKTKKHDRHAYPFISKDASGDSRCNRLKTLNLVTSANGGSTPRHTGWLTVSCKVTVIQLLTLSLSNKPNRVGVAASRLKTETDPVYETVFFILRNIVLFKHWKMGKVQKINNSSYVKDEIRLTSWFFYVSGK
jgi:hypothetical protein